MSRYFIHKPDRTAVNEVEVRKFDSDFDFNNLGIEILKEIGVLIISISSITRLNDKEEEIPFTGEESVIIGSLVRYGKLSTAFIEQFSKGRLEISMILFRSIAETYINIKFFLKYCDEHTLRHYKKHSLRQEKQLLDVLRKNTKDKDKLSHIEKRMFDSIEQAFDTADFDINELNNSSKWEAKIKARLSDIISPDAYPLVFGLGSQVVHGNWQDLVFHHLKKVKNGFMPSTNWSMPRLQILSTVVFFSCDMLLEYAKENLPNDKDRSDLIEEIRDINLRIKNLDDLHEEFIQRKS